MRAKATRHVTAEEWFKTEVLALEDDVGAEIGRLRREFPRLAFRLMQQLTGDLVDLYAERAGVDEAEAGETCLRLVKEAHAEANRCDVRPRSATAWRRVQASRGAR